MPDHQQPTDDEPTADQATADQPTALQPEDRAIDEPDADEEVSALLDAGGTVVGVEIAAGEPATGRDRVEPLVEGPNSL